MPDLASSIPILRHIGVISEGVITSTRWAFPQFIQITLARRNLVCVIALGTIYSSNLVVSILVRPLGSHIQHRWQIRSPSWRVSDVQELLAIESGVGILLVARLIMVNIDPDNRALSLFLIFYNVLDEVRLLHWINRWLHRMLFLLPWVGFQGVYISAEFNNFFGRIHRQVHLRA